MTNEKRLIDANDLMVRKPFCIFKSAAMSSYNDGYLACADKAREAIALAATVDAVEVVHGRWECTYDEATGETDVTCSHCKNTRTVNGCYITTKGESCYFEDNYCPHCGAKMDGERREGE